MPQSTRSIRDSLLSVSTVFGVNNSATSTNAIDLENSNQDAFPVSENITVQIVTTAGTNGANNKNVNISLQDSNVNLAANFTNITGLAPIVIPEVAAGYAATTRNIALPPGVRRYIRARAVTENAGGNPNDGTYTVRVLF